MKQPNRPARWQLDLFILLMIGISLFLMWAELPQSWYTIIECVWSVLVLCGMGVWCWVYKKDLRDGERQARKKCNRHDQRQSTSRSTRTVPLTPVQKHFLDVMNKHKGLYEHETPSGT
jgi:hypothetical protein